MRRVACLFIAIAVAQALGVQGQSDVLDRLEDNLGRMAARSLEHSMGVWKGPQATAFIDAIAADAFSLRSRAMPYRLKILDSLRVDALALPGGYIYLYRGLLGHASSVDELAGVLAHEMAHVEDRDFQRLFVRQLLWLSLAGLARGTSEGGADTILAVGVLNSLRHSRRQEAQADSVGVALAGLAGYDPAGLKVFLDRLRPRSNPWIDRIFETHPDPERRSRAADVRVAEWLRDNPMAAWRICLALRGHGRPARALALAQCCAAWPSHRAWAQAEAVALQAEVRRLAALRVSLPPIGPPDNRLLSRLDAVRDDGRIRQALMLAQSVGPELRDWRYCGLLAATLAELNRLACTLDVGYEAEYRLRAVGTKLNTEEVLVALGQVRRGGLMLAAVLGELLASGRGQPLGALDGARAGLMWAQVRMAGAQVARGRAAVDTLLRAATLPIAQRQVALLAELGRIAPNLVAAALPRGFSKQKQGNSVLDDWLASWEKRLHENGQRGQNNDWPTSREAADDALEDVYIVTRLLLRQAVGEIETAIALAHTK